LLQRAKSLGEKWDGKSDKKAWSTAPYAWVDRPFKSEAHREFNGQEILRKIVLQNYQAFASKSTKSNDFRFIVISGASGTGKTRLGAEIPRIVRADMERLNIPFVYTFLSPQTSIFPVTQRARDPTGRIPRYPDDLEQGKRALAVGIASSYFLNNPTREAQEALVQATKDFTSLESVLKTIRKDKGLGDDTPLVLFIHMDEYQFATPTVLAILRNISDSFRSLLPQLRCVFIPILTGVSPMEVTEVERGYTPTAYSGTFFSLTPLNMDQSRDFVSNVFRHQTGRDLDQSILAHPHFNVVLMLAGGHIRILEYFAKELVLCGVGGFETEQDTKKLIENVQNDLRSIYDPRAWGQITKSSNDIVELMRTAFFHEDITRDMKFNGGTYGDAEQTGLFYLRPSPTSPNKFRLDFPPLLMLTLDRQFGFDLFSEDLVHGALHLEEDFLAYYLQAAFRILAKSKREDTKTLRSIFNGWVKGDKETMGLLNKEITPNPSIKVFHSPPYIPEGKLGTGKEELSKNEIVVRRRMRHEPVDITSGKFIVIAGKRSPTCDIFTPYFDAQAKWQYLRPGQEITMPEQEITRPQVKKEAKKVRDGFPLVIFSPKQLKNYKTSGRSWVVKNVLFVVGEDFVNFMGDYYRKSTC